MYPLDNLCWCFNSSSNNEELGIERSKLRVFDRKNGNPLLKMIDYVINKYKGKPKNGN